MRRWHIRIQRRCNYNGMFPRNDWRAYREFLVWPKTFSTSAEAEEFMERCFTFKGIYGRKMSASVVDRTIPTTGVR